MGERPHKRLDLWQFVVDFIKDIYSRTKKFPADEKFGIVSQIRRSAISIACNIAEGSARKGSQEKVQFFMIARSSVSELDALLEISVTLRFISEEEHKIQIEKLERISRMLQGLISSYQGKQNTK